MSLEEDPMPQMRSQLHQCLHFSFVKSWPTETLRINGLVVKSCWIDGNLLCSRTLILAWISGGKNYWLAKHDIVRILIFACLFILVSVHLSSLYSPCTTFSTLTHSLTYPSPDSLIPQTIPNTLLCSCPALVTGDTKARHMCSLTSKSSSLG